MRIRNTSEAQLRAALAIANARFGGNLDFYRFEPINKKATAYAITLRVKDSHGPGARLGFSRTSKGNRRHLMYACWHAYGTFVDAVFEQTPSARVFTSGHNYNADNWEWVDRNIGSMMEPLHYSEACECDWGW